MKLIYIYAKDYRSLNDVGLNFDSNVRCELRSGCELVIRRRRVIADDFFQLAVQKVDKEKESPIEDCQLGIVDSISAIIGPNGSGKTSVAHFLWNFMGRQLRSFERDDKTGKMREVFAAHVVVIEDNARHMHAFFRLAEGQGPLVVSKPKLCTLHPWAVNDYENASGILDDYVYFSPHYALHGMPVIRDCPGLHDMSSTALLQMRDGRFKTRRYVRQQASEVRLFESDEIGRILNFLRFYNGLDEDVRDLVDLPPIRGVRVTINTKNTTEKFAEIRKKLATSVFPDAQRKEIDECLEALKIDFPVDWLVMAFLSMVYVHLNEIVNEHLSDAGRLPDYLKSLCEVVNQMRRVRHAEGKFGRVHAILRKFWDGNVQDWIQGGGMPPSPESLDAAKRIFSHLCDVADSRDKNIKCDAKHFDLPFDIRDKSLMDGVLSCVEDHPLCAASDDFLSFSVYEDLSSGEYAYVGLWARLYDALCERRAGQNILMFLDEAETTLHPEWQRRLVHNMIWFCQYVLRGKRIHYIFASHSPVLLSDLPSGNVCFLQRDAEKCCCVADCNQRSGNTFGANIFDLYADFFDLKAGPVGEFALAKLNEANDFLSKGEGEKIEKGLIDIIGEPVVKRYFEMRMGESS